MSTPDQAQLVPLPIQAAAAVAPRQAPAAAVTAPGPAPFSTDSPEATFSIADVVTQGHPAPWRVAAAAARPARGIEVVVPVGDPDLGEQTSLALSTPQAEAGEQGMPRTGRIARRVAQRYPQAALQLC